MSPTLLIADDGPDSCAVTEQIFLAEYGDRLQVKVASTKSDALTLIAEAEPFDVVVLDINFERPGSKKAGGEIAQAARARSGLTGLVVYTESSDALSWPDMLVLVNVGVSTTSWVKKGQEDETGQLLRAVERHLRVKGPQFWGHWSQLDVPVGGSLTSPSSELGRRTPRHLLGHQKVGGVRWLSLSPGRRGAWFLMIKPFTWIRDALGSRRDALETKKIELQIEREQLEIERIKLELRERILLRQESFVGPARKILDVAYGGEGRAGQLRLLEPGTQSREWVNELVRESIDRLPAAYRDVLRLQLTERRPTDGIKRELNVRSDRELKALLLEATRALRDELMRGLDELQAALFGESELPFG